MIEGVIASVSPEDRLRQAFDAYNRQDADALLVMMSADVRWATDRKPLHGKYELRRYWDRQWQRIRTHDQVVRIERISDVMYAVVLEQIVCSLNGTTLSTGRFVYRFVVKFGLIEALLSITATTA